METDEELLARSGRDPTAFEPLVERLGATVYRYLARRAPDAAADLLGEVWLRAFASRRSFDPGRGTAAPWLLGVARHVLLAHWSSNRPAPAGPEPPWEDWAAVDARLDAAAVAPALRAALSQLPAAERELLLLVSWEQLSPSEAAAVVGIPAGTARSRLHRARAAMRDRLATVRNDLTGGL
jgi:RNA polymerase sigma-70 factor (ECF subfamily)